MWKRRQLRCSFCGKKETEVSKLVAGPKVYICDECVALANRAMSGDLNGDSHSPETESSVTRKLLGMARRFIYGGGDQHIKSVAGANET